MAAETSMSVCCRVTQASLRERLCKSSSRCEKGGGVDLEWFCGIGGIGRLTVVGEVLGQVEEGEGHQDVEGPVHPRSAGVPRAPGPERIDLRVDGPRHGPHP